MQNTATFTRNCTKYLSVQRILNLSGLLGLLHVLAMNLQIYSETSSLQQVNNIPKLQYQAFLDKCCKKKLGTHCGHDVKSLAIGTFLECIVVKRADGDLC